MYSGLMIIFLDVIGAVFLYTCMAPTNTDEGLLMKSALIRLF